MYNVLTRVKMLPNESICVSNLLQPYETRQIELVYHRFFFNEVYINLMWILEIINTHRASVGIMLMKLINVTSETIMFIYVRESELGAPEIGL